MQLETWETQESIESLSLEHKVGEGNYREVYQVGNKVVKVLKPTVKTSFFGIDVSVPVSSYTLFRYGIPDWNIFEHEKFQELMEKTPLVLRESFAQIHGAGSYNGKSFSLSDLVLNHDGSISNSLQETGHVSEESFCGRLEELKQLFLKEKIYYSDGNPANILVKDLGDGIVIPVLVDYKRISYRRFPFRKPFKQYDFEKMAKLFDKLREKHYRAAGNAVQAIHPASEL